MKRERPGDNDDSSARKNSRVAENPYLAHLKGGRKSRLHEQDPAYGKRRWRDGRSLFFHGDEDQEEGTQSDVPVPQPSSSSKATVDSFLSSIGNGHLPTREERPSMSLAPMKNLDTPGMEWWDLMFLPKSLREDVRSWNPETAPFDQLDTSNTKTVLYIEHPVPVNPTKASVDSDEPMKLYKTKAEMKRERRLRRAQENKEKQDKIALGLIPPPPPKIRLSNLLRVLSTEHAADPSAIEAKVKEEMELRQRQHMARNLASKLTPQERIAKIRRRVERDAQSPVVHMCVFRVTNMELMQEQLAKKRMVKMLLNARKLMINGRVIVVKAPTSTPTMVFVEGGPRSIRKFIRLMLRRIDWKAKTMLEAAVSRLHALEQGQQDGSEEEDDSDSSSSSSSDSIEDQIEIDDDKAMKDGAESSRASQMRSGVPASCRLVWQGTSTRREYDGFHREVFESALDAKAFLQKKNLSHLWDFTVNASDSDAGAVAGRDYV